MSVEFLHIPSGEDVLVGGRRVPMLKAFMGDGGQVMLVFDRRIGLRLDAGTYEPVIEFVADVMENVMNPDCGRTFNRVHEITGTEAGMSNPRDPANYYRLNSAAKDVIDQALREALSRGDNYIGPEHLALALLRTVWSSHPCTVCGSPQHQWCGGTTGREVNLEEPS